MKIVYIGQFNDACGYANAARKYLKIFDKDKYFKENLILVSVNAEKKNYASKEETDLINKYLVKDPALFNELINSGEYIVLVHFLPNIATDPVVKQIIEKSKKNFNIVYWETDALPKQWIELYKSKIYDEIIVNSKWNQEIFSRDAGLKTNLTYLPYTKKELQFSHGDKFTIFAMSQWVFRKGFDILIKAYTQEFFNNTDTQLLIKTYRFETTSRDSEENERAIILKEASEYKKSIYDYGKNSDTSIYIITGHISDERIQDLYSKSNIFCSTARSEGFGMTLADACSYGIPIVALNTTGHIDFIDPKNSFLYNGHLVPISNQGFHLNSLNMNFYEPDILSVRKQLRICYNIWKEDRNKLLEIGKNNREYSLSVLNEERIINDFKNILGLKNE
jgi:glycosyltransferase involved in cell wall biosynthesis